MFHSAGPVLDIHIFVFKFHALEFLCNTVSRPFYMNNPVILTFHGHESFV